MQTLAEACLSYAQCDDYHITADLLTRAGKRLIELEAENDCLRAQLFEAQTTFEAKKRHSSERHRTQIASSETNFCLTKSGVTASTHPP